jgi:hypothetical protein
MKMFISKYKVCAMPIKKIEQGAVTYEGSPIPLDENTPFKIYLMQSFGLTMITMDGKYGIDINAELLSIGFVESEFLNLDDSK